MPTAPPVPFSGGLVNSRDPATIDARQGELSRADDAEYKPDDPGCWKVPGREAFNSTPETTDIVGGRYLEFDGASTDLVCIHTGTAYRKADKGLTGTFSDLVTGLTPGSVSFDSVHQANQHFLLDGVNRNRAVQDDGTADFHGMLANVAKPQQLSGTQTGYVLTSGATMTWWVEERVKDDDDRILRRNGCPATQTQKFIGSGDTIRPLLRRPAIVNPDATHWALYGSATNGVFPVGAEIAEVEIGTDSIEDNRIGTDPEIPAGVAYQILEVSIAGVVQRTSRNGPPPIATTGDVFEESIMLNDALNPRRVWFSFYRDVHSFPGNFISENIGNFFDFDSKEHDEVVVVRTVGELSIILMRNSAHRVLTLPRPEDAAFTPERYKKQIDGAFGTTGPKANAIFTAAGVIHLAYVSPYALILTNGRVWEVGSRGLDWEGAFDASLLSTARLQNNPGRFRIEMYATDNDGNRVAYYFHYHPSHLKPGGILKITGPIHRPSDDSMAVFLSGKEEIFTTASDRRVYVNDRGGSEPVDPSGIRFVAETGELFGSGPSKDTAIRRVSLHHTAGVEGQRAVCTSTMRNEGHTDDTAQETIDIEARGPKSVFQQALGESIRFRVENSDSLGAFAVHFMTMTGDDETLTEPTVK